MEKAVVSKDRYNQNLGAAIRLLRLELGLSQEKFAEIVGIGRTYMGAIERGEKSISAYNLYRILASVDVPIDKFLVNI